MVAGGVAGAARRRRTQPDALRLSDPVAKAPRPGGLGAPRRGAAAWAGLRGRRHSQLRPARRRVAGAARRRPRDRLGLPAPIPPLGPPPPLPPLPARLYPPSL